MFLKIISSQLYVNAIFNYILTYEILQGLLTGEKAKQVLYAFLHKIW